MRVYNNLKAEEISIRFLAIYQNIVQQALTGSQLCSYLITCVIDRLIWAKRRWLAVSWSMAAEAKPKANWEPSLTLRTEPDRTLQPPHKSQKADKAIASQVQTAWPNPSIRHCLKLVNLSGNTKVTPFIEMWCIRTNITSCGAIQWLLTHSYVFIGVCGHRSNTISSKYPSTHTSLTATLAASAVLMCSSEGWKHTHLQSKHWTAASRKGEPLSTLSSGTRALFCFSMHKCPSLEAAGSSCFQHNNLPPAP